MNAKGESAQSVWYHIPFLPCNGRWQLLSIDEDIEYTHWERYAIVYFVIKTIWHIGVLMYYHVCGLCRCLALLIDSWMFFIVCVCMCLEIMCCCCSISDCLSVSLHHRTVMITLLGGLVMVSLHRGFMISLHGGLYDIFA